MADEELPYKAEYAKSGRASCKSCKEKIDQETLRMAAMVQSPHFDGKVPNWFHFKCFFLKQRPPTVADIGNFDSLRYDDQEKIKQKVESASGSAPPPAAAKGKGKKTKKGTAAPPDGSLKEFSVEVTKAGRAGCQGCEQKIVKGLIRISKMDYTSDSARRYGPMPRWHHLECFLELRESLQFYSAASDLPGFYALPADVQDELKGKIKAIKRKAEDAVDSAPPVKKMKKEDEELIKQQNVDMFAIRDTLKNMSKEELSAILKYNFEGDLETTGMGESNLLDYLSDFLTFGMTLPCSVCSGGLLTFKSGTGYTCSGYLSEYTRCTNVERIPKRKPAKIPKIHARSYLSTYSAPTPSDRLFVDRGPTSAALAAASTSQPIKTTGPSGPVLPLSGLQFTVCGDNFTTDKAAVADRVKELGGKVTQSVSANTAAVITTAGTLSEGTAKAILKAESLGVQCVGEDLLDEVDGKDVDGVLTLVKKKAISDWGEDPVKRVSGTKLYSAVHKSGKSAKRVSRFVKSVPDTLKLQLKDGGAVDPDSGLSETAHVLTYGSKLYNSVLGLVDIAKGTNSYYKLQVLESDSKAGRACWVFRSWGRIGTTVGGNKLESHFDKQDAMKSFHKIFQEKTGNDFRSDQITKVAGRWTVLDINYGETKEMEKMVLSESTSKLPMSVQQLIALIFDVDTMKSQMMEFEIDLKKLPLGKLSRTQLTAAFGVLTEAQRLLEEDRKDTGPLLLDCSNRFYTLIPHDFGMNKVPVLDNLEMIKTKIEMVESLSEIEVAYSLLNETGPDDGDSAIDRSYAKLNTKIEPIDAESDEFGMLQKYVKNTHATTHAHYSLKIEDAYKVERKGEAKRFKPFKKLHNHKLLWHGSRLTNFAGILSQGLRIAPPEAPATGYMFGKGIYFADMVSKSANYCSTSHNNPTGIMLLCDVALGNMYERTSSEYVTKLQSGKHSTKGIGRSFPDPAQSTTIDGVEVPLGSSTTDPSLQSSLLYNEYIVYDVAQVQVKYLLKLNFNYNNTWG